MNKEHYAAFDQAIELLSPHILTLMVKKKQTVYKDVYGNEKLERWQQEIDYFIDNVLANGDLVYEFLNESETIGRGIPDKTAEVLRLGGFKSEVQHPGFQWMRVECCGEFKSSSV